MKLPAPPLLLSLLLLLLLLFLLWLCLVWWRCLVPALVAQGSGRLRAARELKGAHGKLHLGGAAVGSLLLSLALHPPATCVCT